MKEKSNYQPARGEGEDLFTCNTMMNLAVKTATISFSVSVLTQPFEALLNRIQRPVGALPLPIASSGFFRAAYRGFVPNAIAGQKRGAVAVTAKQANNAKEAAPVEEEIEAELGPKSRSWVGATAAFSQTDLLLSNGLSNLGKLTSSGVVAPGAFSWSAKNWYQLTKINYGSRSFAGFVNFAAIGFIGDRVSGLFSFQNELCNKIAGGATSGVLATACTTLPNSYADRKVLASTVDASGRVVPCSTMSMFKSMRAHTQEVGIKRACMSLLKDSWFREFLIRAPRTAVAFSTIFAVDYVMGREPLRHILPESKVGCNETLAATRK